ncbi:MAG: hypothetical protein CL811_05735 [Colwelliaceae bacterium]|nr:hypothetical protein [Colwelliaceae bacterium]|tara:strand:- start:1026 stop:1319 length:294 start_codon:yes stop_codon:yes gene_type:complete
MAAKSKKLVDEALSNIRSDRDLANQFIEDVKTRIVADKALPEHVGQVLAKYLEVLQKSNEQLVKVATLVDKNEPKEEDQDLTKEEIKELMRKAKEEE